MYTYVSLFRGFWILHRNSCESFRDYKCYSIKGISNIYTSVLVFLRFFFIVLKISIPNSKKYTCTKSTKRLWTTRSVDRVPLQSKYLWSPHLHMKMCTYTALKDLSRKLSLRNNSVVEWILISFIFTFLLSITDENGKS